MTTDGGVAPDSQSLSIQNHNQRRCFDVRAAGGGDVDDIHVAMILSRIGARARGIRTGTGAGAADTIERHNQDAGHAE